MVQTGERLSQAEYTGMKNVDQTAETQTDFRRTIPIEEQDSPGVRYYPSWSKWFGYYKNVPDAHAVIDTLATWSIGRGYEIPSKGFLGKVMKKNKTKEILDKIRGSGIDSFNSIIKNLLRATLIGGDSFAEIIKNNRGVLKNLKPINPGSMVVISNSKGIITGYEQIVGTGVDTKTVKFKADEILHLAWNRLTDEPHGRSILEPLENIVEMKNEAMTDLRTVFHRYVKPLIISAVDTDDPEAIAAFKTKLDKAVENMENLIVPQGTVDMERMSIPQYSTLDPLPWIKELQGLFTLSSGVPEVVLGFGRETTEASAKILYLAYQQTIEDIQLWLEEQLRNQLKIEVEFNFPADISPEIQKDVGKSRQMNNFEMKDKGVTNVTRKNRKLN